MSDVRQPGPKSADLACGTNLADPAVLRGLLSDIRGLLSVQAELGLTGLDVPSGLLRTAPSARNEGARLLEHQPVSAAQGVSQAAKSKSMAPVQALAAIREQLGDCQRCLLAATRTHLVWGTGSPDARVMLVGEAPGRDEDLQGEPFVGEAGRLLNRMLAAMGLARTDVYIANVIKCRPPKNRYPEAGEVSSCQPYVRAQIEAVRPEALILLGRCASQALLGTKVPLGKMRGQWHKMGQIDVLPTFHPAYLLRNPADKALAWQDLKLVMAKLQLVPPTSKG